MRRRTIVSVQDHRAPTFRSKEPNRHRLFLRSCFSPWLSGEGLPVLGDERIERRRLASADLRDHVVGAREDAFLEIDYSLAQMLDEEGIPCATLGLLRELAVHGPGVMLDGRLLAARGHNLKPRLKAHLLVPDVLAQHPAQDLRDFLEGELDRPVQRVALATVRSGIFEDTHNHAGLVLEDPASRSEEHTSELQSHSDLVCRLLLEKKK